MEKKSSVLYKTTKHPKALESYFDWLCDLIIGTTLHIHQGKYSLLLRDLYEKKFRWSVPNDDNRAFEGMVWREVFCDKHDLIYHPDLFDNTVSMLELMLALANRCDQLMADSPSNVSIGGWFWRLLSNVGLDEFSDKRYYTHGSWEEVDEILNKIIDRTYDRNGNGGLFPLNSSKNDQRKVELWYQMNNYLVEKYY